MTVRVGINGFGRIGKCVTRLLLETSDIVPVHINDLAPADTLVHLFRHDSVHGRYPGEVTVSEGTLHLGDRGLDIRLTAERDPEQVGWGDSGCDVVLECTGRFRDRASAQSILKGGASRVIISAPAIEPDATIVIGVNEETFDPEAHRIVSNASCTTNCLAPVAKVLDECFGLDHGLVTTVHSYTNDQVMLDRIHKDLRRARAAAMNMIPTTTGAAKAVGLVLPHLAGRLDGMAIRVPTPNVSLIDLTAQVSRDVTTEELIAAFRQAATTGPLAGVLGVEDEPLVSSDYIGDSRSSIVDLGCTKVMEGRMVKVLSWYDNEWGFSNRLVDLVRLVTP